MTSKKITFFAALLGFFVLIYISLPILAPFIFSIVAAYILNPVATTLCLRLKIPRSISSAIIVTLLILIIIAIVVVAIPIAITQISNLMEWVGQNLDELQNIINDKSQFDWFFKKIGINPDQINQSIIQNTLSNKKEIIEYSIKGLSGGFSILAASSSFVLSFISFIAIVPIILFYTLRDFEKIKIFLKEFIGSKSKQTLKILMEIDVVISAYLRGQITVCLILCALYSILLSAIGMNFALLVGISTGLLIFLPYIGFALGAISSIVICLFQWGLDPIKISAIVLVFAFGQILESFFLTPNIIGSKVGLHPAIMIFGLLFFGNLFGFTGVLLAIPLSASASVVIKNIFTKSQRSILR